MKPAWRQEDFLYSCDWSEKIDAQFIDYLAMEARVGNFVWPHKVRRAIVHAIDMVNHMNNQSYSNEYALKKLNLLEKRFKVFSLMLGLENVTYNASTNTITAPDDVLFDLLEKEPFAWAYVAFGDPKYEELSWIFANAANDLVVLSSDDDTEKCPSEATGKEFVLIDDEVTATEWNQIPPPPPIEPYAIVPADYPVPICSVPPLDTINVSSSSTQSSLFNWWDYADMWSDDEGSTATDGSTARSFDFAISTKRGFRYGKGRYSRPLAPPTPVKQVTHLSSVASNSPHAKPRTKKHLPPNAK